MVRPDNKVDMSLDDIIRLNKKNEPRKNKNNGPPRKEGFKMNDRRRKAPSTPSRAKKVAGRGFSNTRNFKNTSPKMVRSGGIRKANKSTEDLVKNLAFKAVQKALRTARLPGSGSRKNVVVKREVVVRQVPRSSPPQRRVITRVAPANKIVRTRLVQQASPVITKRIIGRQRPTREVFVERVVPIKNRVQKNIGQRAVNKGRRVIDIPKKRQQQQQEKFNPRSRDRVTAAKNDKFRDAIFGSTTTADASRFTPGNSFLDRIVTTRKGRGFSGKY